LYGSERGDFLVERERMNMKNLGPGKYTKDADKDWSKFQVKNKLLT